MPKTNVKLSASDINFSLSSDQQQELAQWLKEKPAGVAVAISGLKSGEPDVGFEINFSIDDTVFSENSVSVSLPSEYALNHSSAYNIGDFEKWRLDGLQFGNGRAKCIGGEGLTTEEYTFKKFGQEKVGQRYMIDIELA